MFFHKCTGGLSSPCAWKGFAGRVAEGAARVCQQIETQEDGEAHSGEGDGAGIGQRQRSDIATGFGCKHRQPGRRTDCGALASDDDGQCDRGHVCSV